MIPSPIMTTDFPPPPAPVFALSAQRLPPLSFAGFQARMPLADAQSLSARAGGTLACQDSTDPRIRECEGTMPLQGLERPFALLISTVRDSASVIVLTASIGDSEARTWVQSLTQVFGRPNYKKEAGQQETWQWIRRGQMLRLALRRAGSELETSVTLTDGPLLDGLGPAKRSVAGPGVRLR